MRIVKLFIAVLVLVCVCTTPALAQEGGGTTINWSKGFGAGFGAGITILGAGYGISNIAARAVESMARQPEVAGNVNGAMIISAALIEGLSFFALIVCILILFFG